MTQTEAKRFFVDKVIQQAQREGTALSQAEQDMLSWSETDPELQIDPDLPDKLDAEISEAEYEWKITGLLKRSFAAETSSESQKEWRQAYEILDQGDHYILIMIDDAVGESLKRS